MSSSFFLSYYIQLVIFLCVCGESWNLTNLSFLHNLRLKRN